MKKIGLIFLFITLFSRVFAVDGLLIHSIDHAFKDKWYKTLGQSVPVLPSCDIVYRDQMFYIAAVAWDYKLNPEGEAKMNYSIKIIAPDGSIYDEKEHLKLVNYKVPNKDYLQMSEACIGIRFNEEDEFGKYKLVMTIEDLVDNTSKVLEKEVEYSDLPKHDFYQVKDNDDFDQWFYTYHIEPFPVKALSYYFHYLNRDSSAPFDSNAIMNYAFVEIVRNNTFLHQQIVDAYKDSSQKEKTALLLLLANSDFESNDFIVALSKEEKDTYDAYKQNQLPETIETITEAIQLDMLWTKFFVTGKYQPILKLVQTLDYVKYHGGLKKYKKTKKPKHREKALNEAIYQAVVWSLSSNIQQHELVAGYCLYAANAGDLSRVQLEELNAIFVHLMEENKKKG